MVTNPSIDTLLLNLIESLRTEMSALNSDLHDLEIKLKAIDVLEQKTEQKTEHLRETVASIQKKTAQVEKTLTTLLSETVSSSDFEAKIMSIETELKTLQNRCVLLETSTANLLAVNKDRKEDAQKVQQFIIGVILTVFGTLFAMWIER